MPLSDFSQPSGSSKRYHSQPDPYFPPSSASSSQAFPSLSQTSLHYASQPVPGRIPSTNKPRCFECGTHRMRVRRGQLICKYGHVQQHFRIEHAFDDEYEESQRVTARRKMTRQKKKRTFTSRRTGAVSELEDEPDRYRRDEDDDDADLTELEEAGHGRRDRRGRPTIFRAGTGTDPKMQGRFKRLQCLQLVLRMQIEELHRVFHDRLPTETEAVARELWTLLVASLPVSEFPPEPLVAATYDYRARHGVDEDHSLVETDRGREAIYDIEADLELETRLAERDKKYRAEARRNRRRRRGDSEATSQSETEGQTSGTEGWTDEEQVDRDLADPEEMLAALDPVFARQQRDKRRRAQSTDGGIADGMDEAHRTPHQDDATMRSDSDPPDDDDGHRDNRNEHSSSRPSSHGRQGRRRLLPIYRREDTTDAESEWSDGYRSAGGSSAAPVRRRSQRVFYGGSSGAEKRRLMRFASLPSTLAIVYLTLVKLQIPILWGDLTQLAASYRLTFLEAVQRLPPDLVATLNADDIRYGKLDVSSLPTVSSLHIHAAQLAELLKSNFGIVFEEMSGNVVLWRLVDGLGLPPTIYCAAKRLASFLGIDVYVSVHAAPDTDEEEGTEGGDTTTSTTAKRNKRTARSGGAAAVEERFPIPREFMLMATVLMVVKMRFGLDWEERCESIVHPPSAPLSDDPSSSTTGDVSGGFVSGVPRLHRWVEALTESQRASSHHPDRVYDVYRAPDPLDMDETQLDAYLDFLETNLVQPNAPALYSWRKPAELDDLVSFSKSIFPPPPSPSAAGSGRTIPRIEEEHHRIFSLAYSSLPPPSHGVEPGDRYNIYQLTADPAGTLPVEAHVTYMRILEAANRVVGIQPPTYAPETWRKRQREAALKAAEREWGIQATVERVEACLVATLKARIERGRVKRAKR
ncbi:hypothetical protein ACQY0O_007214 [Thecaphora frezii]